MNPQALRDEGPEKACFGSWLRLCSERTPLPKYQLFAFEAQRRSSADGAKRRSAAAHCWAGWRSEMKKLHVGTSPLTNRIFAGHVLKDGMTWAANKTDVTGAACGAVCEHVLANGGPVMVTRNGTPKYEITVRDLEPNA